MKYKLFQLKYFNNKKGEVTSTLEELDLGEIENKFNTQPEVTKFIQTNKKKFEGLTIAVISIYEL